MLGFKAEVAVNEESLSLLSPPVLLDGGVGGLSLLKSAHVF